MTDFRQEAIKISGELIRSIECTLIQLRLLRDVSPPKAYALMAKDIESTMRKQEDWQATAKDRKLKLSEEV